MLRYIFNGLSLLGSTLAYSVPAAVVLPFHRGRHATDVARLWGRTITRLCGIEVRFSGLEQTLDAPSYLVMANHTSHFDTVALYSQIPVDARPVAKRELGYIPVFGWVLKAGAAIMIDRGDREKAKASIQRAAQTIRGGRSVLLFPEGTRTDTETLGPLKKGPFYLAMEARVPILPVGIVGTGSILKSQDWKIHSGKVSVHVGTPLDTTGYSDDEAGRTQMMDDVRAAMEGLIAKGHIPA